MCPARVTAPATTSSRWTDEEHDILVDLTNDQLALETEDESKVISWSRHWDNVSTQLHKHGYSRTPAACLGYWKRTIGAQKANEKAAGPRWEDAEHQILLGMTEEQLELESVDRSATMPWARHWKRVSERLKENGYTRSVDACDAYWNLVQDNSPLAVGTGVDAESLPSKNSPLTDTSVEEPFEVNCGVEKARDQVEEAPELPSKAETPPPAAQSESASLPARWSTVNQQKNVPVTSESPSIEVVPSPPFQKDDSQHPSSLPDEFLNASRGSSSKKQKNTAFRFNPEQRAFLEEEAAKNGSNPDQGRRADIASELGVEEKTNWFVHHRQRSSRRSVENRPRDDFSQGNDFSLPTLAAKRSHGSFDGVDAIEVYPRVIEGSPTYIHQPKKLRLEDAFNPDTAGQTHIHSTSQPNNINPVTGNVKRKAPPRGFSSIALDGSSTSQRSTLPPGLEGAQRHQVTVESMMHIGKQTSLSPQSEARFSMENHRKTNARYSVETDYSQQNIAPHPPKNTESHQSISKNTSEYEPGTPASWNMKSSEARRSSQHSTKTEFPETSSATPQPGSRRGENDKTWASRRVEEIQAQIQGLKGEGELRIIDINRTEQEIEEVKRQDSALHRQKAEEIARVLRDLELRYDREHELLRERQDNLNTTRESDLDGLRKIERQVERNEKKMKSYQTLMDLDDDSEDNH